MIPKRAYLIIAASFFFIGTIILVNSFQSLTGFVIFKNAKINYSYFAGILLIVVGILILKIAPRHNVKSRIKENSQLVKLAEQATSNQSVQREINHLIHELIKGNENPGLGTSNLFQDVYYLRGRNGGRVFYRRTDSGYEILGKASKYNEDKVIDKLRSLYLKKKLVS